jgi:hypothetical protein
VRLFGPHGDVLGVVGRRGSGPGELKGVADAFLDTRGRLYTSDSGNGRIMRFDGGMRFDTSFASPGAYAFRLIEWNGELVAATHERGRVAVWRLDHSGRRLAEFPLPDSAASAVPYWGAILARDLAVLADTLIVSNSLLYPLWRMKGADPPDRWGSPPPSFREASRPALGQFAGARQLEVQDWLRTFTLIDRVVSYRDSLLFVIHAEFRPEPGQPWRKVHTEMDIYDAEGTKLYAEVPLPGRVLSGGDHLYVLTGEPPAGWAITRYDWTPQSSSIVIWKAWSSSCFDVNDRWPAYVASAPCT